MEKRLRLLGIGIVILASFAVARRTVLAADYAALDRGQLKNIHLALLIYAEDHEGFLPPNLAVVAKDYPANLFISPKNHKSEVKWNATTFKPDYVYLGAGLRFPEGSFGEIGNVPLMYTRISQAWSNVLFLDGRVEGYTREQSERLVESKK